MAYSNRWLRLKIGNSYFIIKKRHTVYSNKDEKYHIFVTKRMSKNSSALYNMKLL